jgi:anti-sigma28 factor (negative regulator of flagellin synthesis)
MVGVQGVGGVSEPTPERPVNVRDKRREEAVSTSSAESDGVLISSEAQAAAKLASLVAMAKLADIRHDRVEQARQALAEGTHKKPEVVAELAKRLSKFI